MTIPTLDEACCLLPLGVHAVAVARHFVEMTLPGWGIQPDTVASATLVVSELVTNAVLYGHGAASVGMRADGSSLTVEVAHGADSLPLARTTADDAEMGRGLHVIEGCCTAWGVRPQRLGKVVWATLPR